MRSHAVPLLLAPGATMASEVRSTHLAPEGFLWHLEVFPVGALPSNRDLVVMTGHCIGVVRTTGMRRVEDLRMRTHVARGLSAPGVTMASEVRSTQRDEQAV